MIDFSALGSHSVPNQSRLPQAVVGNEGTFWTSELDSQQGPLEGMGQVPGSNPADFLQIPADQITADLNEPQAQAVVYQGKPLLVMAGAGSGKTRVLTRRIAYLLASGRASADQILAITFTNKAAAEMRQRVQQLVGPAAQRMWVSTFHSACVRILRRYAKAAELKSSFSIYDQNDSVRLIGMLCKEQGVDPKRFPPKKIAAKISDLKNDLTTPDQLHKFKTRTPLLEVTYRIYPLYARRLREANALDFDDLIMKTVQLFSANRQVQADFNRRFRHVLVDEYQDTNHAQYVLVKLLCGVRDQMGQALRAPGGIWQELSPAELTVVGDSDQSIYAFRGATIRNIEEFEKDFPGAHTIYLKQNYRSSENILNAANAVIALNPGRHKKELWTDLGAGEKLGLRICQSDRHEALAIVEEIDRLVPEKFNYQDLAIFYRANATSRLFEETLTQAGIPYRIVGGTKFYDRKEIKDVLAYLHLVVNPDDNVNFRRVVNVPKRGLGDKTIQALQDYGAANQVSIGVAAARLWYQARGQQFPDLLNPQVLGFDPGEKDLPPAVSLSKRAAEQLADFWQLLMEARVKLLAGEPIAKLVELLLNSSGYRQALAVSSDPQDQVRDDNLAEFYNVAEHFDRVEPAGSLVDFLERISLVADADQLEEDGGQVTLMTVHTAKGLEFPVVFVTGLEDGTFPHSRSLDDPQELAEERRLAYVAITRARKKLFLTAALSRKMWGAAQQQPLSRFLLDIPAELFDHPDQLHKMPQFGQLSSDWGASGQYCAQGNETYGFESQGKGFSNHFGREAKPDRGWGATAASRPARFNRRKEAPVRRLTRSALNATSGNQMLGKALGVEVGDRVNHESFGLGTVISVEGSGPRQVARIDFGDGQVKRLLLRLAPMEKL